MARVATISSLEDKIAAAEIQTAKYLDGVKRNQENILKWKEQIENQLNVSVEDLDTEEEKLLKRLERIRAQKERVAVQDMDMGEAEIAAGIVSADDVGEIDLDTANAVINGETFED